MDKMKMQLFGRFVLSDGNVIISEDTLRSGRLTNLLAYLIVHRSQVLTQQKLIELLPDSGGKNPENTLRNLMYRLRNELKVLGDRKFVCTLPGSYQWNPEVQVETDLEEYERNAERLLQEDLEEEQKKELCERIISGYRGNISAKVAGELWAIPRVTRYQMVYLRTVKQLCEIYSRRGWWEEQEQLCMQALSVDAYDEELHCLHIRSLYRQKKIDQAMRSYEKTKRMFYENLGVSNQEKLQGVFREMLSDNGNTMTDIRGLMMDMREQERPNGSFFCDYQIFREVYRIEARRVERLGMAEYVVLLTLRRTSELWKNSLSDSGLLKEMKRLEAIVYEALRTGDVATRFSPTQVLILLPGCSYENSLMVVERIQRSFKKQIGKRQIELVYELEEIGPGGGTKAADA
ncbi:MAG: BTAD domain-containing putative transcriptional regulator [Eubacteriales bacterium]|nr:BTAD domain-containing putative transcriptional regulator [Eubacteriales bacterium]